MKKVATLFILNIKYFLLQIDIAREVYSGKEAFCKSTIQRILFFHVLRSIIVFAYYVDS